MEEVGAQVAPPIFIHQALASRFCEPPSLPRKRDLSYQTPPFQYQSHSQQRVANPRDNWNPKLWEWDTVRFIAKPLDTEILQPGTVATEQRKKDHANGNENSTITKKITVVNEEDESLQLNLGGGLTSVEEPVSRPNKKVRSGSPGSTNYPVCQVDNCKEDLSNAKDYHRRHKVCEIHSKATKALVGKQMQRFCQQCSRFHPLSEFDEGKRSCRRRLAGHNRRRRKTQSEDVTSRLLLPVNRDNDGTGNLDIVNLLTAFARTQGKNEDKSINGSSANTDQLLHILSKINSLPLSMDLAAKLPNVGVLNGKNQEQPSLGHQNQLNGKNISSPSTMDLLAALSATLTSSSSSDALAILSQRNSQSSDSEKTKSICPDNVAAPRMQNRAPQELTSVGERSSTSYQSPVEDSECQIQETRATLPLQLFSSSPEDDSPPILSSSRKYFSSDSSNPMEEKSPSSSPVVQKLFPMYSTAEAMKCEKMLIGRDTNTNAEGCRTYGSTMPLELFSGSKRGTAHGSCQHFPSQAGYTYSSGSDHSPSSLNSDAQDRTGRIIFKLFDKDPSHFPGTLRTQIYNWLSNSPSEMESYIRPGCVVLSVYVSMSSVAWGQLEGNLLQYINCLLQDSDSDFWKKARFLVHAGQHLASHKDGKIRLCKSWRSWNSPELISVSPLAIVGGQETSLLVRGRNLTNPGTEIHCAYMGGYSSMQICGSACMGTKYDELNMGGFKIQVSSPSTLGRCFIEVENGFKGNSFPIIIADANICKELRLLESEFDIEAKASDIISEEHAYDCCWPSPIEEVLHFLNELGWLFQRRSTCPLPESSDYSLCRFKFLLIFSVERDYCALVKVLLDMLLESNWDIDGLSKESLVMLSEIQLLSRAVKRRCRKMADLLIHYSINSSDENPKKYIFPPNLEGAGGITPLHLAACASGSDDMVDVLTNDPQEIGLSCWNSLLDANGHSPYAYAMMRNNHSYNKLVAGKFVDRRNGQVSVTVGIEDELTAVQLHKISSRFKQERSSCGKCAVVATKFNKRFSSSQGLLQRPYVHSMLAIAAVCVCVCLFLRGSPDIGSVAPFKWENLDFGTI